MKTMHILTLLLIMLGCTDDTLEPDDQPIDFPDPNFKYTLVQRGVDKNKDGEISLTETGMVKLLNVTYGNIADLAGIESFENLERLSCQGNQLTRLTINGLEKLTRIDCSANSTDLLIFLICFSTSFFCFHWFLLEEDLC